MKSSRASKRQPKKDLPTQIKKAALKAVVSTRSLTERLVLKGGNAIDLLYGLKARSSIDLDFSMSDDFDPKQLAEIGSDLRGRLEEIFYEEGFMTIDFDFAPRPSMGSQLAFWGGYRAEFKVVPLSKANFSLEVQRRNSSVLNAQQARKMVIEISKCEYCEIAERNMDDLLVRVYTPLLLVCEKLRAICQQHESYANELGVQRRPRPKDFFDIWLLQKELHVRLVSQEEMTILRNCFASKKVPLILITRIKELSAFHEAGWTELVSEIRPEYYNKGFAFYLNQVIAFADSLQLNP